MASYKYPQYVSQNGSDAFDKVYAAGSTTPFSGIYRCAGCGREAVSTVGHPLPPQNHHQHTQAQGAIRWRLITYADHQAKAA